MTSKHTRRQAQAGGDQHPEETTNGLAATEDTADTGDGGAARAAGGGQDAASSQAIAAELEEERAQLERAVGEIEALRDRHLRLAAEFDNYRKRTDRERAESWSRAQAQLVEQLLDALDDLERVAQVDPESTASATLLEGVQLVQRKLMRALESAGLETVAAEGESFDPERHEALMMVPTEVRDEDEMVANVFQKGYSFKGTLLRPARVQVKQYGA